MQEIINKNIIHQDAWAYLKNYTTARLALGRTGNSLPLKEVMELKLAHALAKEAVYAKLEIDELNKSLSVFDLPIIALQTRAINRISFLQTPEAGKRLNENSVKIVHHLAKLNTYDIAIIIADGLSATAIHQQLKGVLEYLIPLLQKQQLSIAPICLVQEARVAIGDEIGALFNATLSIVFIGERPGLSVSNSMGVYITYNPTIGLTDEKRNCISNIHDAGLFSENAAQKIMYLLMAALQLRHSGTMLKDNSLLLSQESKIKKG